MPSVLFGDNEVDHNKDFQAQVNEISISGGEWDLDILFLAISRWKATALENLFHLQPKDLNLMEFTSFSLKVKVD